MTNEEFITFRENTRNLFETKFGNIIFDEEPHKYYVEGVEYTPVSTIISQYENEFDSDLRSKSYAEKNGLTQEEVLRQWKWTNKCATIMGTRAHEYGESYVNMLCGHPELICEQNKPQYLKEENWLVPTFQQEFAIHNFYTELHPSIKPIGAELKLSTQYISGAKPICGTADILFYYDAPNPDNSGFVIGDYKTNRELTKDFIRNTGMMMKPPFDNMFDEPLSHYYLQFNIYQRMMESIGLKVIARRLIHLKRDGIYEVHSVPKIDNSIIDEVILN